MLRTVRVEIIWVSYEDGGKRSIPSSGRYSTVSKFQDIGDKYPQEAWSVVIENLSPVLENNRNQGDLRFLVEDAPQHLLYSGSQFELYEKNLVARGIVIE